jgi:type IV secretory pathway component VirB8
MSIADTFFSTSSLAKDQPIKAAYAAYYLACAFFEIKQNYTPILRETDEAFTDLEFQTFLLNLIRDVNYELIFNHTLREYQITIYNIMSSQSRNKIIALLAMLEIHKNTFKLSNASKWKIALSFIYDDMSKEYAQIITGICQDFKEEDFFSSYYADLCEGHLRRFGIN